MEIEKLSQQFVDYVNFDIRKDSDMLKGAISASMGQGAKKGEKIKPPESLCEKFQQHLSEMLSEMMKCTSLEQDEYNKIFFNVEKKMQKDAESENEYYPLNYFARLQKIINIWIKYHVALAYSDKKFIEYKKLMPLAHIPIDRTIICWFSLKKNNSEKESREKIKKIHSWQRDLTQDSYEIIQVAARNISKKENKSPLELEMEIWNSKNIIKPQEVKYKKNN